MVHPRRLATLTAAVAAATVAVLASGTAAVAADSVSVEIRGLGGTSVAAGGQGVSFQATFSNTTNEPLPGVTAVIAVRLDGASPDSVRVRGRQGGDLPRQTSGDSVIFADPTPFDLARNGGRAQTRRYTLSFSEAAPLGTASVTVAAYKDGSTLGSASGSVTVVLAGDGPRATRTTPPNTDPGVQPTFEAGPTYSVAPLPAEEPPHMQGSVPKTLYVLGGLLIVMGAASLFLIFRPPGRAPTRLGAGPHRLWGPSWHQRGSAPGPQAWPTVTRPTPEPTRRMPIEPAPAGPGRPMRGAGPHTGIGGVMSESGPVTGTRPIREPGPGDPWRS